MSEDLRILVTANLNVGKSIGDINAAISGLEKKINKLKLQIEVPTSFNNQMSSFIRAVEKIKKISDEQNKTISETQEVYKKLDGTVETVTQKVLKNGEVIQKVKRIHDENRKVMQDESIAAQKLADSVEATNKADLDSITILKNKANAIKGFNVKSSQGHTITNQRLEADGQTLVGAKITTNYKKQRDDEQKLIDQMYNARMKSEERVRDEQRATSDSQERQIQKNLDLIRKEELEQKKKTEELEHQLRIYKEQARIKVQDLKRRYDGSIDHKSLNDYLDGVNKLNSTTPHVKRNMDELGLSLKQVESNARTSGSHVNTLAESLRTAFQKFPVWMIAATAFYAPFRGLEAAIDTILAVDKQVTELKRVMDADTNFEEMLRGSIKLSNELGRSITDVNEALTGFARQGFSEGQILDLTKSATLAQNISELNAGEAMDAITAAMVVFNIEASESIRIVDSLNEVNFLYYLLRNSVNCWKLLRAA